MLPILSYNLANFTLAFSRLLLPLIFLLCLICNRERRFSNVRLSSSTLKGFLAVVDKMGWSYYTIVFWFVNYGRNTSTIIGAIAIAQTAHIKWHIVCGPNMHHTAGPHTTPRVTLCRYVRLVSFSLIVNNRIIFSFLIVKTLKNM